MIWGCFNDTQVGNLTIIDGKLTAAKYIELLNENLFQSIEKFGVDRAYVFQYDNDSKHTAKIVNKFFEIRAPLATLEPEFKSYTASMG